MRPRCEKRRQKPHIMLSESGHMKCLNADGYAPGDPYSTGYSVCSLAKPIEVCIDMRSETCHMIR